MPNLIIYKIRWFLNKPINNHQRDKTNINKCARILHDILYLIV